MTVTGRLSTSGHPTCSMQIGQALLSRRINFFYSDILYIDNGLVQIQERTVPFYEMRGSRLIWFQWQVLQHHGQSPGEDVTVRGQSGESGCRADKTIPGGETAGTKTLT